MGQPNTTPTAPAADNAGAPNAGAGSNGGQQTNTAAPTQPAPQPAATAPAAPPQGAAAPAGEPYKTFASQQELEGFIEGRANRAKRSGVRELAREFGFEDVDDFRDAIRAIRGPNGSGAPDGGQQTGHTASQQPGPAAGPDLAMAIQVTADLGLPAAIALRLRGSNKEEMTADAQSLAALMGAGGSAAQTAPLAQPRAPGIPSVPTGGQQQTISRSWMAANPKWVRDNREIVEAASREGRIVN
jgi:hypothetical protein